MSLKCPKCFHRYSLPNHLPMILPSCLHHLCTYCVNSSPSPDRVQCWVQSCKEGTRKQSEELLVYDCHLLGTMDIKLYKIKQEKMHDSLAQFPPSLPHQTVTGSLKCFKCRNTISNITCTSCLTNFCSSCFTTMHSTPGMSSHTSVPYNAMDSIVMRTCEEHCKPLEFVSLNDAKLCCSHCAVFGELRDKKLLNLYTVEREIGESGLLKKSVDKVNARLGKLQSVSKNLNFHSSDYQSNKERLESHLARCHRMVEVVGGKLMSQLRQREEENSLAIEQTRNLIGEKISELEMLVEAAEWPREDVDGERLNLVMLLKEMEKTGEEEDLLLELKRNQKPVVSIDQSIFSNIASHISFDMEDYPSSQSIKTVSEGQLPQELFDLLDRISETKSVVGNRPVRDHFSGMEEVLLLHIESPESFYVMRNADKRLSESLQNLIGKEWRVGEMGKVKVGDIAVVHLEMDKYSRVAVTKVMPDKASVKFLDWGNTSQVPLSSLVSLSDNLSLHSWPPLAHHCTLAASVGNTQWDWQAARALQKFGRESVCKSTVVGRNASISQSTMLVNITKEDDDRNQISLLDYLVYHDLATRQGDVTCKKMRPVRTFLCGPAVKLGTEHSVVVVQVDSPVEMFVIMENNGHAEKLASMLKDMHREYDYNGEAVAEQMILLPVVGMVCVAKFSEDGKFYRAEVTNMMDERMVRVRFVDFGSSRVLQAEDLRRIKDRFLVLPVMALKVGLAEVKPLGEEWSEQAAKCVRERMKNKVSRMVVKRGEKKGTTCMVMMYELNSKEDNCVNTGLVQEGYASATKKLINHRDFNIFKTARPDIAPGMRTACRVVSASSPANICLRRICQEKSFYQLCRELSHHYSPDYGPSVQRHWYGGAVCVVRLQGEGWIRAKVVREEMEGMVEVLMVDYGTIETVAVDSIRTLHDIFTMAPYSWTVHLTKLIPDGGGKTWTVVACEKLMQVLERTSMEVDIQVVEEIVVDTWPVDMFIKEKDENAGPLDPDGFIYKSVGDILKEKGLAIQPRVDVKYKMVNCNGGGDIDQESLKNGKDVGKDCIGKVLVLEIIDEVLEAIFGETKQPAKEEASTSFQWLKADHPNGSNFDCFVSHVDWDCNLYISSIPENQDSLRLIGSVLESKYSGSSPSQEDLQWSPGEACIAQFCLDKKWYRGEVLKVSDTGKCIVKFVDYGSEELCKPRNLRKDLLLTDIPIQCFTVQLDNVRPITEKWAESVLNLMHKTVVDQVLRISITQAKDTFPLPVTLFTKSGMDIGNMLVRNGCAREGGETIIDV